LNGDGYGITDDYEEEETLDEYADANKDSETKSFGWINGVGILVGVAGMFFGIPPIF